MKLKINSLFIYIYLKNNNLNSLKMNKISLLFLMLIIVASCSPTDDSNYSAPSWIQGTWKEESSGDILTFEKDQILYTKGGNQISLLKKFMEAPGNGGKLISKNADSYIIEYSGSKIGGYEGNFIYSDLVRISFIKLSDSRMNSKGYSR
jgi:hypothetical protein